MMLDAKTRSQFNESQLDLLDKIEAVYSGRVLTKDGPIVDGDWLVRLFGFELGNSLRTAAIVTRLLAEGRLMEPEAVKRIRAEWEDLRGTSRPTLVWEPSPLWELIPGQPSAPSPGVTRDAPLGRRDPAPRRLPQFRPPGQRTLVDQGGVEHVQSYADGKWRPRTSIGGAPVRDTTISGLPAIRQTIGSPMAARNGLFGGRATGLNGQSLFERRSPLFR